MQKCKTKPISQNPVHRLALQRLEITRRTQSQERTPAQEAHHHGIRIGFPNESPGLLDSRTPGLPVRARPRVTMRRLYKAVLILIALALTVLIAAIITLQSNWFKNNVRERIIAEVETTTGGHVEIGQFNYTWHNFTAEVAPFVLHGTEPSATSPLFRADKIHVGLKIISFLERTADIASLTVEKPQIHVTVNADGTTNLPRPKALTRGDLVANILNLKIRQFTLANGIAQYNSQRIPLDFRAENLSANLRYFSAPARYAGEIGAHQVHITSVGIRDAAFDLAAKLAIENNRVQIQSATLTQN